MEAVFGGNGTKHFADSCACALGFFDGIHIGHQNLIRVLKDISKQRNLKSMVFTFEKHPMTLLEPDNAPKLITDNITKTKAFEKTGIDLLYYNSVSMDFLKMEPELFLSNILFKQLNVKAIIAGFNFKFGYRGRGDSEALLEFGRKAGVSVTIVEPVYIDGILVSSTNIRENINSGNIEVANKFLGRPFSMHGKVIHGKRRGRGMGFPTANIVINSNLIVPKSGVYITRVIIDEEINKIGITNVGVNPTFGNDSISIETHIVNHDKEIYGKEIKIEFYKRVRDEKRFESVSDLTSQIYKDRIEAIKYFEL